MKKWCYLAVVFLCAQVASAKSDQYDIVVYGGTSSGVVAAIQSSRRGKSVLLVSPGTHVGGMTTSGIGLVDVGDPTKIGGIAREFLHRIWLHYHGSSEISKTAAGPLQPRVEPRVAEALFETMLSEAKVSVLRGEQLDQNAPVIKNGSYIEQINLVSGKHITGKMFIDASYEGDLLAAAGVSFFVGRESNAEYGETLNGILSNTKRGNILELVDPYVIEGSPESGLLSNISASLGGNEGEGDLGVQAYNYRLCMTNAPENRVLIKKPDLYDEKNYELLFRFIEAGLKKELFLKLSHIPNKKVDVNNKGPVSTDFVGMSWNYVLSDYAQRIQIAKAHEDWIRGLIWTLQNHPRVPAAYRHYFAPWGLAQDEFADNGNWPYELYVREGRRMVSDVVITENVVLGHTSYIDAVGIGSYQIDSHTVKYFVADDGYIMSDGELFKRLPAPYRISYRALVPKRGEAKNLLVPVSLSASHVAYGTLRMEPTLMILGQSAATAAALSIDANIGVQDLPYDILRARLLADKQILDPVLPDA